MNDIDSIKRTIVKKYPIFGSIVAKLKFYENLEIETAETDGKVLLYNPNFFINLSEKEKLFLIAHEICHIAFNHINRSKGKKRNVWNIATDAVINAILKEDGFFIIKGAIDIPDAIQYDAEQMYNKLLQMDKNKTIRKYVQNNQEHGKENIQDINVIHNGHDTHSLWNKEVENVKIKTENSSSLVDWKKLLRQEIKCEEEWSRKNAKIKNDLLRYRLRQIDTKYAEILIDTSGSISKKLLKNFIVECKNILYNFNIKVGCFDTSFHGFTDVKSIKNIENLSFQTGGGTDFKCAINAFTKKSTSKLIFTDGKGLIPDMIESKIIWVVYGDEKINPKGCKVIYITDEQLKKLNKKKNKDKTTLEITR